MHVRSVKIGTGVLAAVSAAIFVFPSAASADYAPGPKDVVGVGSDTLQALADFVADGSYVADPGYNSTGNAEKFISIDATADANTRLAYGPGGANGLGNAATTGSGSSTTTVAQAPGCGPGTGGGKGTGNSGVLDTTSSHLPCVLNPTVVLRAGQSPQQRPNGSGAGYNLLLGDTNSSGQALSATGSAGTVSHPSWGLVNFSRASAAKNTTGGVENSSFDSITAGTDDLAMLTGPKTAVGSTPATNAVALSIPDLENIYTCQYTHWGDIPGYNGPAPTATILPLVPQVGSGTRSVFQSELGGITFNTACVQNVEENDPEAIADSSSPANAIEPMSDTRLNLFQGINGATGMPISGTTGYFDDPSCPFNEGLSALAQNSGSNGSANCAASSTDTLAPAVHEWLTSTDPTTPHGSATFDFNRPLYIYFRDADVYSPTTWQPGTTLNWVRTMFYNPCTASITSKTILTGSAATAAGCSVDSFGNEVGPGGAPYFDSSAGQADIADAGVVPAYVVNTPAP